MPIEPSIPPGRDHSSRQELINDLKEARARLAAEERRAQELARQLKRTRAGGTADSFYAPRNDRQDGADLCQSIVESLPCIVWFYDAAGRQFVNRAFNEFTGLAVEEMHSDQLQTLIHPEDAEAYRNGFIISMHARQPFRAQARMRRGDGQWRWMASQGGPCLSPAGEYVGYVGASMDITEQKIIELDLRKREAQLRSAAAAGGIGTYSRDLQTGEDRLSPEFMAIHGLAPDDTLLLKSDMPTMVPPQDRFGCAAELQARLDQTAEPEFSSMYRIILPGGRIRWVLLQGRLDFDDQGRPLRSQGIALDITERKQAEEALRQSEITYRTIAHNFPDGAVLLFDRHLRIHVADGRGLEAVGWSRESLEGRALSELDDDTRALMEPYALRVVAGEQVEFEARYRGRSIHGCGVPIHTDQVEGQGQFSWAVAVFHDVTRIRTAESELALANERLEQVVQNRTAELTRTIESLRREVARGEQAQAQLKEANERLTLQAGQLSDLAGELTMTEQRERRRLSKLLHDGLQQYLASAKMQVEGIAGRLEDAELKQMLGEVGAVLDESLKLSRSLSLDLSPLVLFENGLVSALEWLAGQMRKRFNFEVELEVDAVPALPPDMTITVFEAVRELLFNSVKHSGTTQAQVSIQITHDPWIRIVVRDEGAGFDPRRLKTAGAESEGTGLFSIHVRLKLIGGQFLIESQPGRGSRFTLLLPKPRSSAEPHPSRAPGEPPQERGD